VEGDQNTFTAPQPVVRGDLLGYVRLTAGVKFVSNSMKGPNHNLSGLYHLGCARG